MKTLSRGLIVAALGLACSGLATLNATAEEGSANPHRLGIGVHYWSSVPKVDLSGATIDGHRVESRDHGDEDGVSWLATYQYRPGLLGVGLDVEWKDKGYVGATDDVFEPQLYIIVGTKLYAAAGIGGYYSDGKFADDPFTLLRAGVDLPIAGDLYLDIHAMWRFENWDSIKDRTTDDESDSFAAGVSLRLAF